MGKVAIKIAALPCSSLSPVALARPTMIMGTTISFVSINIDNLNRPIENNVRVPLSYIHSPIVFASSFDRKIPLKNKPHDRGTQTDETRPALLATYLQGPTVFSLITTSNMTTTQQNILPWCVAKPIKKDLR